MKKIPQIPTMAQKTSRKAYVLRGLERKQEQEKKTNGNKR